MEIRWLHERGLIADFWQYEQLPDSVLSDCRLLMEAEGMAAKLAPR